VGAPLQYGDDAEIIAASMWDPELFAVVFDRHAPHIHRYLARRLGAHAADDLLAETFLAAFAKRSRYDGTRPDARPWLYGFASNVIRQHRRDERRRIRLSLALPQPISISSLEDGALGRVAARAVRRDLVEALERLTPGERDVLLLVAWEDLSYVEVSVALEIPIGTVRSRLSRARAKVTQVLGGHDPTSSAHPAPPDPDSDADPDADRRETTAVPLNATRRR
jgi:RNA polymerase sigma factor (sigma-70 family)